MNLYESDADSLDAIFAALSSPIRRAMVDRLAMGPASIQQLADSIEMSLPAINRHVNILEKSGFVRRKKLGRSNILALQRVPLRRLQEWANVFQSHWGTDAETLENFARQTVRVSPDRDSDHIERNGRRS